MGMTIVEKIMDEHSEEEPEPGKIIWIDLDVRSARDFGGANVVSHLEKWYPDDPISDKKKTFFTFDCVVPANNIPYANNQHRCRLFARKHGIKLFDVDRGIGSHVLIEEGLALPGGTVVGTDSHLNILGAVGCFGQGMGDKDIAFGFKSGKTWFEVPESMKVNIQGSLPEGTTPRDLTLHAVGTLGSKGALGKSMEYYGPSIDSLDLFGRITLASMTTEMGGIISFIPPNDDILQYCSDRAGRPIEGVYADPDASYSEENVISLEGLEPMVACPPKPDNVKPASELGSVEIDSVFIGSCTNGTYEDLKAASLVLKGRKVHERVMAKVVPATKMVYMRLLQEGIINELYKSGVIIANPGCGGCASGQIGMTGKGEVQISTSNRNFPGKQGAGDTYLASPETAAASAIAGRIIPASALKEVA